MQWKEIIHLMAFDKKSASQALNEAKGFILKTGEENPESIEILGGASLGLDVCILLNWSREVHRTTKSAIGTTIASAFAKFGWVSHSVWSIKISLQKTGA